MSFKKQNPLVVALYLPQFYETDYNKNDISFPESSNFCSLFPIYKISLRFSNFLA